MANLKSTTQAASNRFLGGIGRAIDVVGSSPVARAVATTVANTVAPGSGTLLNSVGEKNISEKLELKGSSTMTPEQKVTERTSQGKPIAGADTEAARKAGLNFTYDKNLGIKSDKPAYNQQEQSSAASKPLTGQFTSGEAASMGLKEGDLWNGNTVEINGQKYVVKDNGNGTRSFEQVNDAPPAPEDKTPKFSFQEGVDKAGGDELLSKYLNQGELDNMMKKYAEGAFGRADDLASELERTARENADREYNDVMDALRGQGKEVETLGGQQKQRAENEKALTEAELLAKQESEIKDIEQQKAGFVEDDEVQRERLGKAWRDTSLEVQRIMRGRGIADSSFATDKEVKVLKDFNAGLRELAVKRSSALKDFADAVIETNSFYKRKRMELGEEVRQRVEDVDNWVRQQVTSIQNQEKSALSKKLTDINNAILQGKQLKIDIANKVADAELNFGMWLKQTEINYKLAVAQAAKGKVTSATDNIKKAAELSKNMFTMLNNGQAQWVQQKDGTMAVQDLVTGSILPTRPGFKDEYEQLQEAKLDGRTPKQQFEDQTYQGILDNMKGALPGQEEEEDKGILGTIKSWL